MRFLTHILPAFSNWFGPKTPYRERIGRLARPCRYTLKVSKKFPSFSVPFKCPSFTESSAEVVAEQQAPNLERKISTEVRFSNDSKQTSLTCSLDRSLEVVYESSNDTKNGPNPSKYTRGRDERREGFYNPGFKAYLQVIPLLVQKKYCNFILAQAEQSLSELSGLHAIFEKFKIEIPPEWELLAFGPTSDAMSVIAVFDKGIAGITWSVEKTQHYLVFRRGLVLEGSPAEFGITEEFLDKFYAAYTIDRGPYFPPEISSSCTAVSSFGPCGKTIQYMECNSVSLKPSCWAIDLFVNGFKKMIFELGSFKENVAGVARLLSRTIKGTVVWQTGKPQFNTSTFVKPNPLVKSPKVGKFPAYRKVPNNRDRVQKTPIEAVLG